MRGRSGDSGQPPLVLCQTDAIIKLTHPLNRIVGDRNKEQTSRPLESNCGIFGDRHKEQAGSSVENVSAPVIVWRSMLESIDAMEPTETETETRSLS